MILKNLNLFFHHLLLQKKIADKIKKESREFYIPHEVRENLLYGTPFELKLKNKLTQKEIAKECAE